MNDGILFYPWELALKDGNSNCFSFPKASLLKREPRGSFILLRPYLASLTLVPDDSENVIPFIDSLRILSIARIWGVVCILTLELSSASDYLSPLLFRPSIKALLPAQSNELFLIVLLMIEFEGAGGVRAIFGEGGVIGYRSCS